jgi:hypothetical protein
LEWGPSPRWFGPVSFRAPRTQSSDRRHGSDKSVYRPKFNDANLLEAVDVNLRSAEQNGQPVWTPFINYINYDARGQRTICRYANRLETTYEYDEKTFRLLHLKTTRTTVETGRSAKIFKHPTTIQDLYYTYDPVGNITRIGHGALKTVFHANQQFDAACEYTVGVGAASVDFDGIFSTRTSVLDDAFLVREQIRWCHSSLCATDDQGGRLCVGIRRSGKARQPLSDRRATSQLPIIAGLKDRQAWLRVSSNLRRLESPMVDLRTDLRKASRAPWSKASEEKKESAANASRGYWAGLTAEERSAEMKRRTVVRAKNATVKARQEVRAQRNNRRKCLV